MRRQHLVLLLVSVLFGITPVLAQYYWAEDGVPVRQGLHLGWNGAAVASGSDIVTFYYDSRRDGMRDIWGQRFAASGEKLWGNEGVLAAGNISEQRFPVAVTYPDGSILMVWEEYAVGRFRDLRAQRYDGNGNALWSPASGVVVTTEPHDQFNAKVALDANDNAYIAFTDDRESTGPENERFVAYIQILTATGLRVGPLDGIRLVDRLFGHCIPLDIAAAGSAAYVLVEGLSGSQFELILQKVNPDGSLSWPEDPAVSPLGQSPTMGHMLGVEGGLAISWTDIHTDYDGDARLLLIDYDRLPLSGWPAEGIVVAEGAGSQREAAMTEAPNGDIVLAWGDQTSNSDLAALHVNRYTHNGSMVYSNVGFGNAATQTSPVDFAWDGNDLIVAWTERIQFVSETIRTQKLSPSGQKLWGVDGNPLWTRTDKALRVDLVKADDAPARLFLLSGRTVDQPESLLTCTLTAEGIPSGTIETLAGGITYDIFNPRVAEIGYERAMLVWTDSRGSTNRDVYIQILNGQGQGLLEEDGRKVASDGMAIAAPPAIAADGQGGAFIAWTCDSAATINYLQVLRINENGQAVWTAPVRLPSQQGFQAEIKLVADGLGGVYAAYSDFSPAFILRAHAAHVTDAGALDWTPDTRDFTGQPNSDMTFGDAAGDGQHGLFLAITSGPWTDTDVTLFHLGLDGTPGLDWTLAGRNYGEPQIHDTHPQLLASGNGAILTYLRENTDGSSTSSVRGILVNADGQTPWGSNPRTLVNDGMHVTRHVLIADGAGGFFETWEDTRELDQVQVRINRFDGNGISIWNMDGQPVCTEICQQDHPAVSPDGNGGAWITWQDNRLSDEWGEIDLFATHLNDQGEPATVNGFTWPANGDPMVDLPTYQQDVILIPWLSGSAMAIWVDRRSSNPGRCCGAGAVGDIFDNIYAQVLSEISLGADEEDTAVRQYELLQSYPNPFNATTQITYALPRSANIRLSVVNVLGQEVAELVNAKQDAGTQTIRWDAAELTSGIYFIKLESDVVHEVKKLVLMK